MVGLKLVDDVGLHFIGKGCPSLQVIPLPINSILLVFSIYSFSMILKGLGIKTKKMTQLMRH